MKIAESPRTRTAIVMAVAMLAVALRVAYAWTHADWMRGDAETYHRLASQLAEHGYLGYSPETLRSWRPPLYPGLLAAVYAVTGPSILAGKLVQCVVPGITVVVVSRLGDRLHSYWAGLIGAALYATLGSEIRHATSLYPETLLALLAATFALSTTHDQTPRRGAWQGLLSGLMCLMQPALALLPMMFAAVLVVLRRDAQRHIAAVAMIGTLALALTPWSIRNAAVHGRFVLVSTNGGFNLYKGNNPHTDVPPSTAMQSHLNDVRRAMPDSATEVERDALWREAATDWIKEHPGEYASLAARRGIAWIVPSQILEVPTGWPITYGTAFPFLLVGAIALVRRRDVIAIGPGLVLVAALTPTIIAVYADARYRRPAMAVMATIAGCGAAGLADLYRARRQGDAPDAP